MHALRSWHNVRVRLGLSYVILVYYNSVLLGGKQKLSVGYFDMGIFSYKIHALS